MKKIIKFLSLILVLISINSVEVEANSNPSRIFGNDRIRTAIEVSKVAYPNNADIVILAGYDGQVDSLSGTILAHSENAPMLLTKKDKLHDLTLKEIERLNPSEIYILGGENVVSKKVEDSLSNYEVTRAEGRKRESTAVDIARKSLGDNINEVFLTLGYDEYADALAIGPISGIEKKPILLTKTGEIPKETKEALGSFGVKKVTIIGGEAVISKAVEADLESMNIGIDRVHGKDRMETALNIAKKYINNTGAVVVANGYNYADAVIGGYFAAKNNAPILLSRDKRIDINSLDYISDKKAQTYVLGGERVIYKSVFDDIDFGLDPNVAIKEIKTEFEEAFNIIKKDDSSLPLNKEVIKQKGVNGIRESLDRVYYRNDKQFRRQTIVSTITKRPINQIVHVGTKR